jgi:hypothetical protein
MGMPRRAFSFRAEPDTSVQMFFSIAVIAGPETVTIRFAGYKTE